MINLSSIVQSLTAVFMLLATAGTINAQQASLNLEGIVSDEATGRPVGCKIFIWTPSNKRITISSNVNDGSYLQTLSEAGTHKLAFSGYNIYRKEITIDMPKAERFRIIKHDIKVRTLVEGTSVGSVQNAFDNNAATLTSVGKKLVDEMIDLLRINQELNLVVGVSPDQDQLTGVRNQANAEYKKSHDAWQKAVKKVKKGQPVPDEPEQAPLPPDPNVQLMQDRIATVRGLVKDVKSGDVRIAYKALALQAVPEHVEVAAPKPVKAKKGKKAVAVQPVADNQRQGVPIQPALVVSIGKVKKLYD